MHEWAPFAAWPRAPNAPMGPPPPPPRHRRQACEPVLKTLLSAAANAKQNLGMRKAKLVVSECYANEGPVLKRARPRAQVRPPPYRRICRNQWRAWHCGCAGRRIRPAHT
jgi:hypothetical protein